MFLLDTNIISESRKLGTSRINARAALWLAQVDVEASFISVMTLFELERGVQQMERRDSEQGAVLRRWFEDQVIATYEHRTLSMSPKTSRICAGLHIPNPKSERDAWIAATAIEAELTLVTRNVSDFADMGVGIFNPFEES